MFDGFNGDINSYLSELKILESELVTQLNNLPGDWFMAIQVERILSQIDYSSSTIEKNFAHLSNLRIYKLDKLINKNIQVLENRFKKLLFLVEKNIRKLKLNKTDSLLNETRTIMSLLIKSIHELIFLLNGFALNKIKSKKIIDLLFDDILNKRLHIPDLNYSDSLDLIKNYTDEELILVLQYKNSREKPYLFITKDQSGHINRFILKISNSTNKSKSQSAFLISKLMGYLDIRNYNVVFEHKYYEEIGKYQKKEFLSFVPGNSLVDMGSITEGEKILSYAFFLGAALASGYILKLSDRLVNIHISEYSFSKIDSNYKSYLGFSNPIYHIDYEFSCFTSVEQYFSDVLFRITPDENVYYQLLFNKINLNNVDINKLRSSFLEGFEAEVIRVKKLIQTLGDEFKIFLEKNNLLFIYERIKEENIVIFKNYETKYFNYFKDEYLSNL